jgi:ribosomal-protein-alanine N-acetyltransferase
MSDLRLVPLTPAVFHALAGGDVASAEDLLGLPVPDDFAGTVDIWAFMLRLLEQHPANADWAMRAVVVGSDTIVGNAGFKGAPAAGQVELGYRISPGHRRRGHAVHAVRLLLDHARREPTVDRVIARIAPENHASVRVVTAAGFVPDGQWTSPRWGRQLQYVTHTVTA